MDAASVVVLSLTGTLNMAYSDSWDENNPSGADDADTIDDTMRTGFKAIRERLADVLGGLTLLEFQADPILAKGIRGGGDADFEVKGGTATTTLKDSTGANSDLQVDHSNGAVTIRGDVAAAGGFRRSFDGWAVTDVAGTTGPTEIVRANGRPQMLRAGSITGILLTLENSQARTAGTLTVTVWRSTIDLVTGLRTDVVTTVVAVLDATNPVQKITLVAKDAKPFSAGDEIFVKYQTVGWTPTTADFRVVVEVEQ